MAHPKPGWHALAEIDRVNLTAICAVCGPVKVIFKARKNEYRCWVKYRQQQSERRRRKAPPRRPTGKHRTPGRRERDKAKWGYRTHKADSCAKCGFIPEHPCQLDVDHVVPKSLGGTDAPENLQTLCANCHRLKSYEERLKTSILSRVMPPPPDQPLKLWSD